MCELGNHHVQWVNHEKSSIGFSIGHGKTIALATEVTKDGWFYHVFSMFLRNLRDARPRWQLPWEQRGIPAAVPCGSRTGFLCAEIAGSIFF